MNCSCGPQIARVAGDRGLQALERLRGVAPGGQPRRRDLEELAQLQELVQRHRLGLRQQADVRGQEVGDVIGGGEDHEAAAGRALRRADQVLRGQDPQRLADRGAADAELHAERRLVRQSLTRGDRTAEDEVAQLVGDLLVGLADARDLDCALGRLRHPRESTPGRRRQTRCASRAITSKSDTSDSWEERGGCMASADVVSLPDRRLSEPAVAPGHHGAGRSRSQSRPARRGRLACGAPRETLDEPDPAPRRDASGLAQPRSHSATGRTRRPPWCPTG